jgi:hypothetical protein
VNQHLSARQISEWLLGERAPMVDQHLRVCGECAEKLEQLEGSLTAFKGAVRDWSEQHVRRMPEAVTIPRRRWGLYWPRLAATAAALGMLVAVPVYVTHARHEAEIARQDDFLLQQVAVDVSRSVAEPMEPLNKLMFFTQDNAQEKPE